MAGLITSIDGLGSSGLVTFLTGGGIATSTGRVEQFRNNLRYNYGDIINGVTEDGKIFDIRVSSLGDFEFGNNLSFNRKAPDGVVDAGDSLSIDSTAVRRRLEQSDISRVAYGLLLASKGEITEEELNTNPAYTALTVIERKDAFDRLNIDSDKIFSVNGAEFELSGDEIRIRSLPGQARSSRNNDDLEIARARKKLEAKAESLGFGRDTERVPMKGASISALLSERERLESQYTYVGFSFQSEEWVASNTFKDVFETIIEVPDAFLMGANLAYQIEMSMGDDFNVAEKNAIFPAAVTYFSSLILGAITGLPTQLAEEFEFHAGTNLYQLYDYNEPKTFAALDTMRPKYEDILANLFNTISEVPLGANLEELRGGLEGSLSGSVYSLRKYTSAF